MIQHLRIDFPPVIKSQTLMELGRVNILTGRNSSGKSTVLRRIVEKPDIGITFHRSKEWESSISTLIYKNMPPNVVNLGSFIDNVLRKLDGKIFLSIDGSQVYELLSEAKRFSPGGNMVGDHVITMITNMVTTHELPSNRVILLYPKRQLADYSNADAATGLDSMAKAALSRLFHLQNQPKDSKEKIVYESIFNNFYDITGKEFYIQTDPNKPQAAIQLLFRRVGGSWILSHNEGLGLAEVLTILLYSLDGNYQLIMIEEPENHLHPDLQRRLLSFLNSVEDRQYILSTHSPVFLNPTMADRIYLCRYGNGEIKIDDNTKRAEALTEIGVLAIDNLTSDAIIISEGKTDGEAINYIVKNWFDAPSGVSIIHVDLRGSNMMDFDPKPFAEVRSIFALLDRDPENAGPQKAFIEACAEAGIIPTRLDRYCLENYYTLDAIRAVFGENVPDGIMSLKKDVPPWKQLVDGKHTEKWWQGMLKSIRQIPKILDHMKMSDMEGTDLLEFCRKIRSVL